MKIRNTISLRLTLWYSLVLLLALSLFGILLYSFVAKKIYDEQIGMLMERTDRLAEYMRIDDHKLDIEHIEDHRDELQFEENGVFFEIKNSAKTLTRSINFPAGLVTTVEDSDKNPNRKFKSSTGFTYHCLITRTTLYDDNKKPRKYTMIVGQSVIYVERVLNRIRLIVFLLIPLVILSAGAGGWYLARRSMKPVANITSAARDITLKNLDMQLPAPRNPDDELGKLVLTFNDMIERIRTGVQKIQQFTGDASHELRTPLTIMHGEIEVALRKSRNVSEYKKILKSSLQELIFMEKIVNDLLSLSRIDAGQVILQRNLYQIGLLMDEAIRYHKNSADSKYISIQYDNPFYNTNLLLDPDKIRQVFMNILDNAVKYSRNGGRINIYSQQDEKNIYVFVEDNGIGIPEKDLPFLFDRFYRADKARSRAMYSSGLGLSICKWIIEAHQGDIVIFSTENKGTTVKISLPLFQPVF
ncbi:heavy metal sensor histidine kinase [candidate division KSB1 bacterium]|nr:heavy metal sensor histidine kinase [candidate division KSB1 bacterium]